MVGVLLSNRSIGRERRYHSPNLPAVKQAVATPFPSAQPTSIAYSRMLGVPISPVQNPGCRSDKPMVSMIPPARVSRWSVLPLPSSRVDGCRLRKVDLDVGSTFVVVTLTNTSSCRTRMGIEQPSVPEHIIPQNAQAAIAHMQASKLESNRSDPFRDASTPE